MSEAKYMTAVFACDLRKFGSNPFHQDTPFGRAQALSTEDVFEERDALEQQRDDLLEALTQLLDDLDALAPARPSTAAIEQAQAAIAKAEGQP